VAAPAALDPSRPHFGIFHARGGATLLEPTPEALHDLLSRPLPIPDLLTVAPLYVVPSTAEQNLERRA